MKHSNLKFPLLIAALYFGSILNAQEVRRDTLKEQNIEEVVMIGYGTAKKGI